MLVFALDGVQFLIGQFFEVQECIMRLGIGADQFVELDLHGGTLAVLRVLDQKHHEERDDGRTGIDHKLPRVAVVEVAARERPNNDDQQCDNEGERMSGRVRSPLGKRREGVARLRGAKKGEAVVGHGMNLSRQNVSW